MQYFKDLFEYILISKLNKTKSLILKFVFPNNLKLPDQFFLEIPRWPSWLNKLLETTTSKNTLTLACKSSKATWPLKGQNYSFKKYTYISTNFTT